MIEERTRFGTSWLIVRDEGGSPEVLTLGDEEKTLPVFSWPSARVRVICRKVTLAGNTQEWHRGVASALVPWYGSGAGCP